MVWPKELAKILKPLVGKSPHHINSTKDFVEQAKQFKLEPGECLSPYDMSGLVHLSPHRFLPSKSSRIYWTRTPPSRKEQLWKLETLSSYWSFVSKTPTSLSKASSMIRVEGAAMGSPFSQIVANLYMEYLEQKALSTAPHSPSSGAGM